MTPGNSNGRNTDQEVAAVIARARRMISPRLAQLNLKSLAKPKA